jgi:hypothetical protein
MYDTAFSPGEAAATSGGRNDRSETVSNRLDFAGIDLVYSDGNRFFFKMEAVVPGVRGNFSCPAGNQVNKQITASDLMHKIGKRGIKHHSKHTSVK